MLTKTPTLGDLREEFFRLRKYAPSTYKDYQLKLAKGAGDWMDLPITEITPDLILQRHKELSRMNGPHGTGEAYANDVFRIIRAMFNFGKVRYRTETGRPMVSENPVSVLKEMKQWNKTRRRETMIRRHQLPDWLRSVLRLNSRTMTDFIIFLWLTGCRKSEAANLKWSDVDLRDGSILVRATKSGSQQFLPISQFLIRMLERRYQDRASDYVFPSRNDKKAPLSCNQGAIDKVCLESGIKFMNHDLRRGFISTGQSINVPLYIIKRLVNHKTTFDMTSGYIVFDPEDLRMHTERITHALLRMSEYDVSAEEEYGIPFDAGFLIRKNTPVLYDELLCGGVKISVTRHTREKRLSPNTARLS